MVKYYYDKYNANATVRYTLPPIGTPTAARTALYTVHKSYRWDDVNGIFITDGEKHEEGHIITRGTKGYRAYSGGSYMEIYELTDVDAYTNNSSANYNKWVTYAKDKGTNTTYSRGSLIQSNVIADSPLNPKIETMLPINAIILSTY